MKSTDGALVGSALAGYSAGKNPAFWNCGELRGKAPGGVLPPLGSGIHGFGAGTDPLRARLAPLSLTAKSSHQR
jgi:hypothetical protein